jgi:esterase
MTLPASEHLQLLHEGAARWSLTTNALTLPDSHQITLDGMQFRYVDWGGASRLKAIVLLHGGGLTAHAWDLVCLGLKDKWRCVALDARGHGDSEWSKEADYRISSQRADVLAFLDHLGLERVALIGHSMGGFTSISLAAHAPHRVAALTLVDIGPDPREEGTRDIRGLVSQGSDFASIDDAVQQVMAYKPARNPQSLRRSLQIAMREGADGRWRWKYDPGRYAQLRTETFARERRALWTDLAKIQCPAQVIRGEKSRVFWQEDAERVAATMAGGRWVIAPGAGHNVHSENPRVIIDSVVELLERAGY